LQGREQRVLQLAAALQAWQRQGRVAQAWLRLELELEPAWVAWIPRAPAARLVPAE
jgi:hypothetical protein